MSWIFYGVKIFYLVIEIYFFYVRILINENKFKDKLFIYIYINFLLDVIVFKFKCLINFEYKFG